MQQATSESTRPKLLTEGIPFSDGMGSPEYFPFMVRSGMSAAGALEDASCALDSAVALSKAFAQAAEGDGDFDPSLLYGLQRIQLQAKALIDSVICSMAQEDPRRSQLYEASCTLDSAEGLAVAIADATEGIRKVDPRTLYALQTVHCHSKGLLDSVFNEMS